jgi:hypothetical protein
MIKLIVISSLFLIAIGYYLISKRVKKDKKISFHDRLKSF